MTRPAKSAMHAAMSVPIATGGQGDRIVTLDVLRGVAVMGILAINILGFALPSAAAGNPYALGEPSQADLVSWLLSFIFIEGKMRGLFSVLFGASMLLVIDRAEAAGRSGPRTHITRMAWLLVFGILHHYFIWIGDILILYAAVGLVAWVFYQADLRVLLVAALLLLVGQTFYIGLIAVSVAQVAASATAPGATAASMILWEQVQYGLTPYSAAEVEAIVARHRAPYGQFLAPASPGLPSSVDSQGAHPPTAAATARRITRRSRTAPHKQWRGVTRLSPPR